MLAYVTLGSNDTEKAVAFYDALAPLLGARRMFDNDRLYFYGRGMGQPMFVIGGPYDEKKATIGNGVMPAIACVGRPMVDAVYKKALELGATDEGEPGARGSNFYGAYFRDLDGHKICICTIG